MSETSKTITELKHGDFVFDSFIELVYMVLEDWKDEGRRFSQIKLIEIKSLRETLITKSNVHRLDLISDTEMIKQHRQVLSETKETAEKRSLGILKQVKESLEFVYPDNWDITRCEETGQYTLIIKFPEITIVNSKRLEHKIVDLYVRWKFDAEFKMITSIEGVRGTLSYVEYKCGYRHSHLQGKSEFENSPKFSPFCLGTGDYAETQRTWLDGKEFNQEDFELLLYQTGAYVRWESLGGGPYFRMENIAVGGTNTYVSGIDHHFRNIVRYLNSFPMKFDYTTKRFVISRDQIEDVLSDTESNLDIPRIKKTSCGEYLYGDVSLSTIRSWIINGNDIVDRKPIFVFKGQKIYQRIIEIEEKEKEDGLKIVPHPSITKHVVEKLTSSTNHYFIKKYGK